MKRAPELRGQLKEEVVSAERFGVYERAAVDMDDIEAFFRSSDDDRIVAAELFQEIMGKEGVPLTTKLQALKRAYNLIDRGVHDQASIEIARTLIDVVRGEKNLALKIRYAAMLASELQPAEDEPQDDPLSPTMNKRRAFTFLHEDQEASQVHRAWAAVVLNPKGWVTYFAALYKKDSVFASEDWDQLRPELQEEIVDQFGEIAEQELDPDKTIRQVLDHYVRLPPGNIPSRKKRVEFEEIKGLKLGVSITIKIEGEEDCKVDVVGGIPPERRGQYIHVDMTQDIAQKAEIIRDAKDRGEISSEEVLTRTFEELLLPFLPRMHPEQEKKIREAIAEGRISARHITYADKLVKPDESTPEELSKEEN